MISYSVEYMIYGSMSNRSVSFQHISSYAQILETARRYGNDRGWTVLTISEQRPA